MRVLHLIKTAVGATWALRQTKELVAQGIEVHIAMPEGPMTEKYRLAGMTVHEFDPSLALTAWWKNRAKARALAQLVEQVQPDIVHSHFVTSTLLMRLALRHHSIPKVFHIPGPLHLEHVLYRYMDLRSANQHDYYLASCKWTRDALNKFGVNKNKIGLAYYGVNAEDFLHAKPSHTDLRGLIGADNNTFVVGMVAYFYAPKRFLGQTRGLKGHEDLIEALAIVLKKYPFVRCVMIGGPWGKADRYFESVKRFAHKKVGDACVFLGTRQDVPSLYPQFDLAVHPSHSENVGGAVESMYSKIPTLTTNVGGFPDLIEPGVTGYMAKAKDPVSLAAQICQAIEQKAQSEALVERGLEKVSSVMNVKKNALEVSHFYQHVLADHKGRTA
ncbi:glycosyltransferase family 1 protein [Alteromonas sediminis]|uniref:Glycosyltransferase family 1 protein n=1 Tax=Alteromonas sediminis TaxID=2259342 RepID=A0A3N5YPR0_9ALTE|nr:glycosyltransferase family 4 protein [Alteromonas sediminis]RPJ67851.1 glycosyltransferase family 1 protein [Alteromonas sediminis]